MASLAVLTVAVGEVQVSLSTGIAVLPGVVGFAVTAASEVLTGAISEVRLAVATYRGDSSGHHKHNRGTATTQTLRKRLHKSCEFSPKIRSVILPLQNGSGLEELLPLSLSHCVVPRKAAQPRLASAGVPRSPGEAVVALEGSRDGCRVEHHQSQPPDQAGLPIGTDITHCCLEITHTNPGVTK